MDLNFTLYPKQNKFVVSKERFTGFVGSIGSGKSRALCIKGLIKALNNPGSFGCITAPSFPMLKDATKRTFFDICPPELIAYENENENLVALLTPSGKFSEIVFRSTSDPNSLRGPNLLWVGMDEASISSHESFLILMGRIRAQPASEQQLFVCTTPKGFNWVYDEFGPHIDKPDHKAFYASIRDNIFLPTDYVESLEQNYTGSFAQQELEGKFVAYEGLIYGDLFNYDLHVGSYPFDPSLSVDLAWDFGYPSPEAVLAIQQDARGNIYIIDEIYRIRVLTEDIVAEARSRVWWKNVGDCVADEARPDLIMRLQQLGVPARAGSKGKILDGIAKIRSIMASDKTTKESALHIDKRAEMLIKEMGLWRWADTRGIITDYKEKPIDAYNHALDCFRYWAMSKYYLKPAFSPNRKPPKRRVMSYQLL